MMSWKELWPGTLGDRSVSATTLLSGLNWCLPSLLLSFPYQKQEDWIKMFSSIFQLHYLSEVHTLQLQVEHVATWEGSLLVSFSPPTHPEVADGYIQQAPT